MDRPTLPRPQDEEFNRQARAASDLVRRYASEYDRERRRRATSDAARAAPESVSP